MSGLVVMAGRGPVECVIDWSEGYLRTGEYIDGDLGWSVQPSRVGAELPVVGAQRFDDRCSVALIRGGQPGAFYMLGAEAETNTGRRLVRSILLQVGA